MTNVPQNIRDMWADVYRLFDLNYNMTNDADSWLKFWNQADEIRQKHDNPHVGSLILVVSEMIEYNITNKVLHPCTLEQMKLF